MGPFNTSPLSSGYQPAYNPFGGGSNNLLLQLLMPLLQQQLGGGRFMPAQFSPMQGLSDQFRSRQYFEQQQELMKLAAQQDRRTYERMFLGISDMTGTPIGPRQRAAAQQASSDIAAWAPFLSQVAPEAFDAAHGRRGSATILAQALHRAGTNMTDPLTGRVGLSLTAERAMTRELYNRMVGPGANLAEMRGIGAGSGGLILEQLRQRGLAGGGIVDRTSALASLDDATLERVVKDTKFSFSDAARIRDAAKRGPIDVGKFDQQLTGDMLASFDAQKTARSIKSMTGAVAAMREIFGDAGNPDAPMRELFAGLEALTQSSLATHTGPQLEQMVRRTQALARGAGVNMEGVLGLTAGAANLSDQFGLDRMHAVQATQGALAFRQAIDHAGLLNNRAYGNLDADKLTMFDQRLRLAAAASPAVNRMNAVLRLSEQGVLSGGAAAAMVNAIKAGQTSFTFDGKTHSLAMNENSLINLLGGQASAGVLREAFRATHANQEYGLQYRTMDLGRRLQQAVDIDPQLQSIFAGSAGIALTGAGIGDQATRQSIGAGVGATMLAAMNGMSGTDALDPAKRRSTMTTAAKDKLATMLRDHGITLPAAQVDQLAAQMVTGGLGSADQFLMDPRYGSVGLQGFLQANNPAALKAYARAMSVAEGEAAMDSALAGLGSAGLGARLSDALQEGGSMRDVLNKTLGNISISSLDEVDPRMKAFRAALLSGGTTGAGQITALRQGGGLATAELSRIAAGLGLSLEGLTEEAVMAKGGTAELMTQIRGLQAAERQGLDGLFKDRGYEPGRAIDDAERGSARALTDRMRSTGMAINLGDDRSLRVSGRNIGSMTDLLAIAKRYSKQLGFEGEIDTEGEARDLMDRFLMGRRSGEVTGLTMQEMHDLDKLETTLKDEAADKEMTLSGVVEIAGDFKKAVLKLLGRPTGANEAPIATD